MQTKKLLKELFDVFKCEWDLDSIKIFHELKLTNNVSLVEYQIASCKREGKITPHITTYRTAIIDSPDILIARFTSSGYMMCKNTDTYFEVDFVPWTDMYLTGNDFKWTE